MNFKDMVKIYLREAKKKGPNKNFGGGGCDNAPLDQTMCKKKKQKKNRCGENTNGGCGGASMPTC